MNSHASWSDFHPLYNMEYKLIYKLYSEKNVIFMITKTNKPWQNKPGI